MPHSFWKSLLLFFLFLPLTQFLFAQPIQINNTLTPQHVQIPGTKLFIIPPDENFLASENFTGLQNEELEAAINITELPIDYKQVLPMFTKDLPPEDGEVLLEKNLRMNGYYAKLYKTKSIYKSTIEKLTDPDKPGKPVVSWLMIYGKEGLSITLMGVYADSLDAQLSEKFERSMLSFVYKQNQEVSPTDGLMFTLDLSGTPLKFASTFMQTGAIFNAEGKFPSKIQDQPSIMVMVMPVGVPAEEQKNQAIRIVKKPHKDDVEITEVNEVLLGGIPGYEVLADKTERDGSISQEYAVTLFDADKYFLLLGNAISGPEDLEMLRKIIGSFELKN